MKPGIIVLVTLGTLACSKFASGEGPATRPAIVPAKDWGSAPKDIPQERKHEPKYVTIHHAGVLWKDGDDPVKKLKGLQVYGQKEKNWPDLPYHFLISPDGRIFEGRSMDYEPETNTEYKTRGHLGIQLWGDFTKQRPTKEQVESCMKLAAWLCQEKAIAPENVRTHQDYAKTECPGTDFYRYMKSGQLRQWLDRAMKGQDPQIELGEALPGGPTTRMSGK